MIHISFEKLHRWHYTVLGEAREAVEALIEDWRSHSALSDHETIQVLPELLTFMHAGPASPKLETFFYGKAGLVDRAGRLPSRNQVERELEDLPVPPEIGRRMVEVTPNDLTRAIQYLPDRLLEAWSQQATSSQISRVITEAEDPYRQRIVRASRARKGSEAQRPDGTEQAPTARRSP